MMRRKLPLVALGAGVLGLLLAGYLAWPRQPWSETELATLRSLWIGSLPALPPDPTNAVADDERAVRLGQRLFFDTRLSSNGRVACASCHRPNQLFQDGTALATGVGTTNRRTPSVIGIAHSPWFFWDGRKDSLWAQALGPLESPVEHGGTRTAYAHVVAAFYRAEYEALFGPLPDLSDRGRFPASAGPVSDPQARAAWEAMAPADREAITTIYANMGKAIAAYQRRIQPGPARFDRYVAALLRGERPDAAAALTPDEQAGLRLFIGKAQCLNCHSGPLLTDTFFHNIGVPAPAGLPADPGRAQGAPQVLADEFNCLSRYSDAAPEQCAELRYMVAEGPELEGQFKTPTLRNSAERAPYMHAGQLATLRQVLEHYNQAPAAVAGHSELEPLNLTDAELRQLEAFLRTLSGPLDVPPELLVPPQ